MKTLSGYAWLTLRAVLRHAYGRVFAHCARRGLNGPSRDLFDAALENWLARHF